VCARATEARPRAVPEQPIGGRSAIAVVTDASSCGCCGPAQDPGIAGEIENTHG